MRAKTHICCVAEGPSGPRGRFRAAWIGCAAALSATLAACASSPGPDPDLRVPAAYETPVAGQAPSASLDRWWTVFDDPQLAGLIESALTANPDARSAAARLAEARAVRSTDVYKFLPQGQATASASRTQTRQLSGTTTASAPGLVIPGLQLAGAEDAYRASLDVSWEIDFFGRAAATRRAADADVAAARFDYESARASLAAQTADAYFQARGLATQLADAHETARVDRDLYDIASERAATGLAPRSDADRAAGDLARADAAVETLGAALQAQKRTLLILAGRTFEPTVGLDTAPDVGGAPDVPASLPSDLLRRRPDVRRAEAQFAAALGRRRLARLAFLPTFTLRPGLGWSKTAENGGELALSSWTIVGAATQPILDLPTLAARLGVQDARVDQAAATYEKTLQTAFGEAEGALVRLEAGRRRILILAEGEARARRAFLATRLGYERGLNDLQTALSAETSWRATRAELTSAQVNAVRDAIAAFKAIGGGWQGAAPQTAWGTS